MENKTRNLLIGILAITWLFSIVLGYFIFHKPFSPELAGIVAQLVWRIALAFLVIAICGGVGGKLLRMEDSHPLARLSVQAGLGLGLMALVMMTIGLLGGFKPLFFALLLLGSVIIFRREILAWLRLWRGLADFWKESSRFWKICGALAIAILGFGLMTSLAPPIKYDALMYHLTMPQAYIQIGSFPYLPWIVMSGMPQTTEMLYTLAMGLGGAQGATVLGWFFALLSLLGLAGFARGRLDNPAGWVAPISLLVGFTFAISMAWGYVDWLGLFFGLGAILCLDEWRDTGRGRLLFFAGLFAGFAFSTKYTAGFLSLALFGAFCWHSFKRREKFFPPLMLLVGGALLAALPWLSRNWVNTGNPVYPFFLPGGAMDAVRIGVYQGLPAWGDWRDLLLLPIRATVIGSETAEGYSVSAGPLLLGLGALSWIGYRKLTSAQQASLQNAAWVGCLGLLLWVAGNQASGYLIQTRMYFSIFPAFAILAAFGFYSTSRVQIPGMRVGRLLQTLIILVLGLNTLEVFLAFTRAGVLPLLTAMQSEQQYRDNNLGWFNPAMDTLRSLPEGEKALLLYEPRGFLCLPKCDPDEILDRWKHDLAVLKDPQSILASWRHQGFTYILYNKAGTDFLRENPDPHHPVRELDQLNALLSSLPLVQNFGGAYQLFRIPPQ
jgi:hypothetical protein